jgi:hypothetical protein
VNLQLAIERIAASGSPRLSSYVSQTLMSWGISSDDYIRDNFQIWKKSQTWEILFFVIGYLPFIVVSPWPFFFSDLTYPRCTNELETDCGSAASAFSLFIAWNLLSMMCAYRPWTYLCLTVSCFQYISANMFTGIRRFFFSL